MKKHFYILTYIILIIMTSCSDSVVGEMFTPSLTNNLLSITPNELTFSEHGESKTVNISTTNTPWHFVDYPDWITISPNSGSQSSSVTITAKENTSADVTRTCVFYLESTDDNWSYKAYVSATQKNAEAYISPNPSALTFDANASSKTIEVASNIEWEFKCNETWLSIVKNENKIEVSATENTTGITRKSTIQLFGGKTLTNIDVVQQANGLSCSVEKLEFDQKGGRVVFTVNSQTAWTAKASNNWITISPTSGNSGLTTVNVDVTESSLSAERFGDISFIVGSNTVALIPVYQKGTYLDINVESLSFYPDAESKSITISSNVDWIINTSESWLKVSDKIGSGDRVVTVAVDANKTNTQRSSIIIISSADQNIVKRINITQSGILINTELSQMHFPYKGGSQNLALDINTSWNLTSSCDWLNYSSKSGTREAKSLLVTATENNEEDDRAADITINAGGFSKKISVIQDGKFFKVDNDALTIPARANTISLKISTTESWEVDTDASWMTINPSSGTGDAIISIFAEENNSSNIRKGVITFKPADGRYIELIITQKIKSINISSEPIILDYKGSTEKIIVTCDGAYNVTSTTPWIKINNVTSTSFDISAVESNMTDTQKEGSVTISIDNTSISKTIRVYQEKMPEELNYVDLGLPSGTKWCKMNYGATSPGQLGTECKWAQTVGEKGRKPTKEEFLELINKCTWTWKSNNEMDWDNGGAPYVIEIRGRNNNTILLPMGWDSYRSWMQDTSYWTDDMYNDYEAYYLSGGRTGDNSGLSFSSKGIDYDYKNFIRPVLKE